METEEEAASAAATPRQTEAVAVPGIDPAPPLPPHGEPAPHPPPPPTDDPPAASRSDGVGRDEAPQQADRERSQAPSTAASVVGAQSRAAAARWLASRSSPCPPFWEWAAALSMAGRLPWRATLEAATSLGSLGGQVEAAIPPWLAAFAAAEPPLAAAVLTDAFEDACRYYFQVIPQPIPSFLPSAPRGREEGEVLEDAPSAEGFHAGGSGAAVVHGRDGGTGRWDSGPAMGDEEVAAGSSGGGSGGGGGDFGVAGPSHWRLDDFPGPSAQHGTQTHSGGYAPIYYGRAAAMERAQREEEAAARVGRAGEGAAAARARGSWGEGGWDDDDGGSSAGAGRGVEEEEEEEEEGKKTKRPVMVGRGTSPLPEEEDEEMPYWADHVNSVRPEAQLEGEEDLVMEGAEEAEEGEVEEGELAGDAFDVDEEEEEEAEEAVAADTFSEADQEEFDTTASQYAAGKDIQGIPWERLQYTRLQYRDTRIKQYRNYTNILPEDPAEYREDVLKTCQAVAPGAHLFDFVHNYRAVLSNIVHFQLRNLVWAASRHDVFVVHENVVVHHNLATGRQTDVLDISGGTPRAGSAATRAPVLGRVQVSTLCVQHNLVAAGGFSGELAVRRLDAAGCLYADRVTNNENGITNGIEVFQSRGHGVCVAAANNDAHLRVFAAEPFRIVNTVLFPWAVNYATVRPDSSLVAVVGDDPTAHLVDLARGITVRELVGHRDFSFAAAWHPDGNLLATGNQDTTAALWDMRRTATPLCRLPARMGAVRTLRFSADGRFLVFAEPADFVHVFDCRGGIFEKVQELDLFGEIAGVAFTPDSDSLLVGVSDVTYSSLLQYDRHHRHPPNWHRDGGSSDGSSSDDEGQRGAWSDGHSSDADGGGDSLAAAARRGRRRTSVDLALPDDPLAA